LEDYRQLLITFLEEPSKENFLIARNFVVSHETYSPYDQEHKSLEMLYSKGEYETVNKGISALMPNWLLSPYIHIFWSMVANKLSDQANSKMEMFIAQMCIKGILSTGDGSPEHPFLVTRTLDEYDILREMNKELEMQSLNKENGKHLDYLRCKDGTEIVFDITDLIFRAMQF
jgi:hypothetical protein